MRRYTVKGLDSCHIGEELILPDIAELLMAPQFHFADADAVWKHGTDFHRELLSKVPFKGDRKYTTVFSETRLVVPETYSSFVGHAGYHIDNLARHIDEDDLAYLLQSECSCPTEFLAETFDVRVPENITDDNSLMKYIETSRHADKFSSVDAPFNRIISFTNHFHRATRPKKMEFRFIFRAQELHSLYDRPEPATGPSESVGIYNEARKFIKNIEHFEDRIVIYKNKA